MRLSPICLLALSLLFVGCSQQNSKSSPMAPSPSTAVSSEAPALVTQDQQDPYEINNMKKAMASVINKRLAKTASPVDSSTISLEPNYVYVKFTTVGHAQDGQLFFWDTNLVMQRWPLDKKIITYGKDPSLPDSVNNYWVAVPVGYKLCPGIKVDTLKKLYLPNPRVPVSTLSKTASKLSSYGVTPQELEYESLRLSGDTARLNNAVRLAKTSVFTPNGTITYHDVTRPGNFPQQGMNVVKPLWNARITYGYWYYWDQGRTDGNGWFLASSGWSYGVDYHLHFDTDDYYFNNYNMISGPTGVKSAWNLCIDDGVMSRVCTAYDAFNKMWYDDIEGVQRPYQGHWYNIRLQANIYNRPSTDAQGEHGASLIYSVINLWLTNPDGYQLYSPDVYYDAVHEVSHSIFYENFKARNPVMPRSFEIGKVGLEINESYATGMGYHFTLKRYPQVNSTNYHFYVNMPFYYDIFNSSTYCGLIEDLVDNDSYMCGLNSYANGGNGDIITGFALKDVSDIYMGCYHWWELKLALEKAPVKISQASITIQGPPIFVRGPRGQTIVTYRYTRLMNDPNNPWYRAGGSATPHYFHMSDLDFIIDWWNNYDYNGYNFQKS